MAAIVIHGGIGWRTDMEGCYLDTREEAREFVRDEALDAGLDEDTADACVDAAMSAYEDLKNDQEAFEDMVASVIQGHAMP
jgi:hypothetical protein